MNDEKETLLRKIAELQNDLDIILKEKGNKKDALSLWYNNGYNIGFEHGRAAAFRNLTKEIANKLLDILPKSLHHLIYVPDDSDHDN